MDDSQDVYALLKKELQNTEVQVLLPNDEGYAESIKRWSEHCEKRASAVIKPTTAPSVCTLLSFIRTHNIPFVVRGGGHSTSGSSSIESGLVIDLSLMRKVTVDEQKKEIRVEGGAIWEDVDVEAAKYGLATVGGTVNHTGVGGLTLGGGYGYLTGRYGLTIDNLLSVDIVLASGTLVTASLTQNTDLFWAIRGAGQNFGVVTAFTFRGHPQPNPVFAGTLVFPPDKIPQIVAFANKFHEKNNGDQAMLWGFSAPPPTNTPVVLTQIFHNGPENEGREFFADLISLDALVDTTSMIPYAKLNSLLNHASGFDGRKAFGGGAFKLPLDPSFVQSLHREFCEFTLEKNKKMGESLMLWETIPYKKVREVGNGEMAFSNRGEYYNVATCFKWFDPTLDDEIRSFSRTLLRKASQTAGVDQDASVRSQQGVGVYGNYSNTDVAASDVYGANTKKLEELKHKYDADNLFDRGTRLVPRPLVVVN